MHHQPQKLLDPHVVMFEYDRSQRTQAQPPAPLLETHDVAFSTPSLVGAPRVCMSSFGPFLPSLVTCCHHFLPSKVRRNYIHSKRRLIKSSPADPSEKKVPSTPNSLRCKAFRSKSAVANEMWVVDPGYSRYLGSCGETTKIEKIKIQKDPAEKKTCNGFFRQPLSLLTHAFQTNLREPA